MVKALKSKTIKIEDDEITSESIEECIKQYTDDIKSEYNFITDSGKQLDLHFIKKCENNLDRKKSIDELDKFINNSTISKAIENSIFEYTAVYAKINDIVPELVYAIYNDKLSSLCDTLNPTRLNNNILIENLKNNKINPKNIAFLNPMQLFPEKWEFYNRKKNLRKYKEDNMSATDNYTCYKCKEKKCKVTQMQTRSADEPITNFIVCLSCGNTWKC